MRTCAACTCTCVPVCVCTGTCVRVCLHMRVPACVCVQTCPGGYHPSLRSVTSLAGPQLHVRPANEGSEDAKGKGVSLLPPRQDW